jgi:hypothetical protein
MIDKTGEGSHRIQEEYLLCDVGDEFHDKYGLSDTGTTKESNFTTASIRSQQINDFNTSDKNFIFGTLQTNKVKNRSINQSMNPAIK